jgi:hypothetical protein
MGDIRVLRPAPPRQMQREIRIAQLIRVYPTERIRQQLRKLVEELEVTDTGNGQLITNFTQFGVCSIDWQGPREEFILDNME